MDEWTIEALERILRTLEKERVSRDERKYAAAELRAILEDLNG